MTKELFEVLEALCGMWSQYCQPPSGHCFMSAGEEADLVLSKYKLLKEDKGTGGVVDWDQLEAYRNEIDNRLNPPRFPEDRITKHQEG